MPAALLAAYHSARGEWREFLPHGLAAAAYDTPDPDWLFDLAVRSATAALMPFLPPAQVTALATGLARAALHDTGRELAANEP